MEVFEKATAADAETIFTLYQTAAVSGRENGSSDWDDSYPTREILKEDLNQERLYVLWENGELLAAISLMESDDLDEEPLGWTEVKSCVPVRLCVSPTRQCQGIGGRMMTLLTETVKRKGYAAIRLLAAKENLAANRLYERMGFCRMGEVHLYDTDFYAYERLL